MKRPYSSLAILIGLACIYFLAGKLGLSLAFINASASAVWPPTGLALVAVLLLGYRVWPAIFVAAFLVNLTTTGFSWGSSVSSLGIASGNTLEALVGGWLVNRFAGGRSAFDQSPNILRFILLAAGLSTAVSATMGVTTLCLGGFAPWAGYGSIWLTWWIGDAVSDFVLAPFLLIWLAKFPRTWKSSQLTEALLLTFFIFLIGQALFAGWFVPKGAIYAIECLAIPPLIWAAWRFGLHGASAAALLISVIAINGTLRELGPFALKDHNAALIVLQTFVATITLTVLILASVVQQRNRAFDRLNLQYDVGRALAESTGSADGTRKVLEIVCTRAGWD
ncbi:MAG TPA: MASE1 domain-containing protein, partial [Opitutaceae bacterium]|nr:MASE1 domain-containing protein [Opitutaceae bacterium]